MESNLHHHYKIFTEMKNPQIFLRVFGIQQH